MPNSFRRALAWRGGCRFTRAWSPPPGRVRTAMTGKNKTANRRSPRRLQPGKDCRQLRSSPMRLEFEDLADTHVAAPLRQKCSAGAQRMRLHRERRRKGFAASRSTCARLKSMCSSGGRLLAVEGRHDKVAVLQALYQFLDDASVTRNLAENISVPGSARSGI